MAHCDPRRIAGIFEGSEPSTDNGERERMDWWQTGSLMGTLVLAAAAVVTLGWRALRQEGDRRRHDIEKLRQDNREAHQKIGDTIVQLRDDLGGQISQLRDDLSGQIVQLRDDLGGQGAQLREGQASMRAEQASFREGLGELRGEVRGLRHSVDDLREDFRAHVFARND